MQKFERKSITGSAFRLVRPHFVTVAILSAAANLLLLTGPIYMLQIYDRVLASGSLPTLAVLSIAVVLAFSFLGLFDWIRLKVMARIASIVECRLFAPAFQTSLERSRFGAHARGDEDPVDDVETVRQYLAAGGPIFLFDAPWLPIFLLVVFVLHPLLGILATVSAILLVALTLGNEWFMRAQMGQASNEANAKRQFIRSAQLNGEAALSMGMSASLINRAEQMSAQSRDGQLRLSDTSAFFSTAIKVFRLLTQSAILGLGAMLAVWGQVSPGAMIAASIISARALSPVEQAVSGWRQFTTFRRAVARLYETLGLEKPDTAPVRLPAPSKTLSVSGLRLTASGREQPVLDGIGFGLQAGDALGVIGASAAGKTSLARALTGLWIPSAGEVRLDGARLDQWTPAALSRHLGYLPQKVELFSGTISDNIARFDSRTRSEDVIAAAEAANVHELILSLPDGYQTVVGRGDNRLSAGQMQRIALARALYGKPFLVVLDEPNSALDQAGEDALLGSIKALRQDGSIVVLMTHRPRVVAVTSHILVLANGTQHKFGLRDDVLGELHRRAQQEKVAA